MERVLVCAATRAERDACERGIRAGAGSSHEMLCTGVGPVRAGRSLAERLARGALPDVVVSSGFAGALSPRIALSSWITALRIVEWNGVERIPVKGVALADGPSGLLPCEVLSSSRLVNVGTPMPPLDGERPLVVDMESAALAREATRRGVRFSVLRLISDTPQRPLPPFLSPFAAAMASTATRARVSLVGRGLRAALADPRAVLRLLDEAPSWLRLLERGWERFSLSPP